SIVAEFFLMSRLHQFHTNNLRRTGFARDVEARFVRAPSRAASFVDHSPHATREGFHRARLQREAALAVTRRIDAQSLELVSEGNMGPAQFPSGGDASHSVG